ncbi:MAG: disulfide oxidoreductase [Chloroflexi bacterium]|nr:disulfide oxidoreductase [Chloroflexota bacterium]MDA1146527.1 disulfide oxidoreductase [Chloroflexota bacterium]
MSEAQVSPLLAVLALTTVAASIALAASISAPGAYNLRALVLERGRWLAFLVAAVAMASSLYYSEVVGFVPCEFCWYQRIAMYPLVVVLAVAAVIRDDRVFRYVLPIAVIGSLLSIYHYQLQLFPDQASSCSTGVPCHARYVEEFGFVSIPLMALCGFIAIIALHVTMRRARAIEEAD